MQTYGLNPTEIEQIPVSARNPAKSNRAPIRIDIPQDKDASKQKDQRAPENVKVYSDGSAHNGQVGAAAILIRPGKPKRTLYYHLGSTEEHTVYEAELVGLLLGLQLLKTEKIYGTSCVIGADNHAAIKAIQSELTHPGQYLAANFILTASQMRKKKNKKYTLALRWTAGHTGIEGNEDADAEAKKAAAGRTSDTNLLPPILRRPLAISTTAVKQKHKEQLKKTWVNRWRESPRGKRITEMDNSTPSRKFIQAISNPKLPRRSASAITQLRISHVPLNSYLSRFCKVNSAHCPACGENNETVEHFLLHCPGFAHERWALKRKAGDSLTLASLLANEKTVLPLANYIDATHRFTYKVSQIEKQ